MRNAPQPPRLPRVDLLGCAHRRFQLCLGHFQLCAAGPKETSHGSCQRQAKPKSCLVGTFSSPCPEVGKPAPLLLLPPPSPCDCGTADVLVSAIPNSLFFFVIVVVSHGGLNQNAHLKSENWYIV